MKILVHATTIRDQNSHTADISALEHTTFCCTLTTTNHIRNVMPALSSANAALFVAIILHSLTCRRTQIQQVRHNPYFKMPNMKKIQQYNTRPGNRTKQRRQVTQSLERHQLTIRPTDPALYSRSRLPRARSQPRSPGAANQNSLPNRPHRRCSQSA